VGEKSQKRRYPRVPSPKDWLLAWQAGTSRGVSRLESLGLGGLFVLTREPVPLRSMVKVLLDLPLGEVRALAVVRRILPKKGMGIEFISMDQADRARLNRALVPLLAEA
jgi:PilZ domain-containing protein